MLYKVSHLIPHKHLIYFIRHSLYVHLYQDRTTNSQLSHAVLSPRTPNARQTPRGRQDNHTDTSCITSTLDGNHRPSDLFIEPVNTTPSYGKPYVHNTMDGQMSHVTADMNVNEWLFGNKLIWSHFATIDCND